MGWWTEVLVNAAVVLACIGAGIAIWPEVERQRLRNDTSPNPGKNSTRDNRQRNIGLAVASVGVFAAMLGGLLSNYR